MASDCWGPDYPVDLNPPYPLGSAAHGVVAPVMPDFRMIINQDGIVVSYGENGEDVPAATVEAKVILTKILPPLLKLFLEKNRKYASVQKGYDLGPKGIIPDINRKVGILVDRLWHGNPTVGEETEEVIDDLIGHLLLMKAKMRR